MIARIPPPTTVDDLERFSDANPGWQVEREADGTIAMSPTNSEGGRRNARLIGILLEWNDRGDVGEVFESSTGFKMPDGAILSPDAAWIGRERWLALPEEQRSSYAPIVPDVCIEIVSPSQSFESTVVKARRYRAYGATFVLVLDPQRHALWSDGDAPENFPTDFSRIID